ncbi:helix-turn-helix domain-containing protein [Nocardia sp. NPDC004068]|uniref:helix-turn-helix domain-containing protein n=1 Tax=Nocardia sp. NPDC004068 TaxID=3364303 RepID=UPI0036B0FC6A
MRQIDRAVAAVESHPIPAVVFTLVGLAVAAGAVVVLRKALRAARRHVITAEQAGTVVAAAIATGVSAQGMWVFFDESLHLPASLRVMFFSFLEIMVITSALRARAAQRAGGSAGVDGVAMWVLTCLSAVLAATDADNLGTLLIRLSAPLVAAWGWERSMALERRRAGHFRGINWRLTPERILIRLGLADPTDRTPSEVATQRRLIGVALAHDRVRTLLDSGARGRRVERAKRGLQKAMRDAVEEGGLITEQGQRTVLLDTIAILSSTSALLEMRLPNPWEARDPAPATEESASTNGHHPPIATAVTSENGHNGHHAPAHNGQPIVTLENEARPHNGNPVDDPAPDDATPPEPTAPISNGHNGFDRAPETNGHNPFGHDAPADPYPTAELRLPSGDSAARQLRRDPDVRARVRELYAANLPLTEIAAQVGISRRTVGRIVADLHDQPGRPDQEDPDTVAHNGSGELSHA